MNSRNSLIYRLLPALLLGTAFLALKAAQKPDSLSVAPQADGSNSLSLSDSLAGRKYRLSFSDDLKIWTPLATLPGSGASAIEFHDATSAGTDQRFYRSEELPENSTELTGDHFQTNAGLVTIHPVDHASFVMQWGDKVIINDPVGGASAYAGFPKADLVLVGHSHSDHYSSSTLAGIIDSETIIVAPQDVYTKLSTGLKSQTTVLANGGALSAIGLNIDAVPAYNAYHPLGRDNGYILSVGGKRIYMSGDTDSTTEMWALTQIDIAFLAMNTPFTMTVDEAAAAARTFLPKTIFPYHYRNSDNSFSDLARFSQAANEGAVRIDVRARAWY